MYVQYFYAAKQVVHTPLTRYYRVEENKKEMQEAGQYYIAVLRWRSLKSISYYYCYFIFIYRVFFLTHVVIIIRGEHVVRYDRCTGATGVVRICDWRIPAVDERDLSARGWTMWSVYEKRENKKKNPRRFIPVIFLFINRLYVIRTHVYV